jgi:glycosyltransferase involved in cell wall biosynthesis
LPLKISVRILITEEALRLGNGHWPRYVQDLAEGFRAAGDHVDVLAHKDAAQKVFDAVPGAVPWFHRDCRADARSQGLIGGIRHNVSFCRDLAKWLDEHEPYDWVLSLSSRPKHLLAFALLARKKRLARTRYLVLFVLGFGKVAVHRPVGGRAEFRPGAANAFAKLCFALLRGPVRRGQVVLAAETKGMQGELQRFSGLPASLYPHPVELLPEVRDRSSEVGEPRSEDRGPRTESSGQRTGSGGRSSETGGQTSEIRDQRSGGGDQKVVTVIAPGFARHEKGSDLLQDAIKIVREKAKGGACFVLQWQEDFPMPDGTMMRPDEGLKQSGDVDYLGDILTGSQYFEFLAGGDIVVLPYRSASYSRRVSRVSVEAAFMGKPIVYTRNTWSAEVAEMAGCGVEVSEETPASIAHAILSALEQVDGLRARAASGASAVRGYYCVAQFRRQLAAE